MAQPPSDLIARYSRPRVPPLARPLAALALSAPMVAIFALFFGALLGKGALYIVALIATALGVGAVLGYRRVVPPDLRRAVAEISVPAPAIRSGAPQTVRYRGRVIRLDETGFTVDRELISGALTGPHGPVVDDTKYVVWGDVERWIVCRNSGGPRMYEVRLHEADPLRLFRPNFAAHTEAELLDAVQRLGGVMVVVAAELGIPRAATGKT